MNFEIPPELNVRFTGGPDDSLSTTRLAYLKKELRENPSVSPSYIRKGVQQFLPGLRGMIDGLPMGSYLLITPSTTNTNRIPTLLATEFKKLRPDIYLVNLKEKDIKADHRTVGKLKDNYLERSSDHRHFIISDKLRKAAPRLNQATTYLLDDSISTGDTAVMLHRELGRAGIHARGGILTAVARERYFVRPSDLSRLHKKMLPHLPPSYAAESLANNLYITFAGFPRKKIINFERSFTIGKLSGMKEAAFNYVQKVASYLTTKKLDPSSVLLRQKQTQSQQVLPPPDQKRRRGPRL